MRLLITIFFAVICMSLTGFSQSDKPNEVVFKNVCVFDGVSAGLSDYTEVYIVDNNIKEISSSASKSASKGATVNEGEGRVLLPGLNDTHSHISFAYISQAQLMFGDPTYNHIYMVKDARECNLWQSSNSMNTGNS